MGTFADKPLKMERRERGAVGGSKSGPARPSRKNTRPQPILLITDPGPDPDDVKSIISLAVFHIQQVITLKGVVCNGGNQAARRAQLARHVLDML